MFETLHLLCLNRCVAPSIEVFHWWTRVSWANSDLMEPISEANVNTLQMVGNMYYQDKSNFIFHINIDHSCPIYINESFPALGFWWKLGAVVNDNNNELYMDGLMQERRNSIANALELRLSCTNPLIYCQSSTESKQSIIHLHDIT